MGRRPYSAMLLVRAMAELGPFTKEKASLE
jgi:hypothetical protein